MTEKKTGNRGGRVVLFLFGTPFALVGFGMLFLAVIPNIYDWVRMHSWTPVGAQLLSANLKSHRGDKSTTYEVIASYRYRYNGIEYTGNRVGISEKSDNIGDWHQRTYSRIRAMNPMRVWVNPGDPREAVFDRDLRWAKLGFYMIFVLVFGGAGVGIIWFALRKPVEIPEGIPLWQGNPAWSNNLIRSNAKAGLWGIWVFAAFWNLISSPVIFAVPGEWAKGNHPILIALLFPLVGMGMIIYAVMKTREWRRFGPTPLQLDPFPGSIGGDVGGTIQINQTLPGRVIANVQLSCVYVYSRGSGKNRETVHDVQWQDQQRVRVEPGLRGSQIKFRFSTPEDLPSSQVKSMPYYEWTLEVSCDIPGADLSRTFEIPVFDNGSQRQSMVRPLSVENAPGTPIVPDSVMRQSQTAQGLRLYFPLFRALGSGIIVTLVGGVFAGIAWVFAFGGMRHPPPLIFPIVFGPLGLLALLGGLYMLGNSLTVVANSNGIQVTRRVFGFPFNWYIPVANIRSIDIAKGMQSSQGNSSTLYYTLKVHTSMGRKVTVAESLPGASAARTVMMQIKTACGIKE